MSADKVIHEFKKNALEKVVCQFREFKRNKLVDIRVFYEAENEEWRPTTKGISLRLELIPELKQAIDKAAEEWGIQLPGRNSDSSEKVREVEIEDSEEPEGNLPR